MSGIFREGALLTQFWQRFKGSCLFGVGKGLLPDLEHLFGVVNRVVFHLEADCFGRQKVSLAHE